MSLALRSPSRARSLDRASALDRIRHRLIGRSETVARIAGAITERCRQLTIDINALEAEIKALTEQLAPTLLGDTRMRVTNRSEDPRRNHRPPTVPFTNFLRRTQRQLPAARLVLETFPAPAQPHRQPTAQHRPAPHRDDPSSPPPAGSRNLRRKAGGDGGLEALRILKRRSLRPASLEYSLQLTS